MKKGLLFSIAILYFFFSCTGGIFAEEDTTMSYGDYRANVSTYCRDPRMPWNKDDLTFGKITVDYEPLDKNLLSSARSKLLDRESDSEERARIEKSLSDSVMARFTGYRALEIARVTYQNNMNRIFSCAVVAGRYDVIKKVTETINNKYGQRASDITRKLEKEKNRYDQLKNKMNCGRNTSDTADLQIKNRLASSAMNEYCGYQYYLDYLRAQVEDNTTRTYTIDRALGGSSAGIPRTTDQAVDTLSLYQRSIERDLLRAYTTLPKALVAYREMERTYPLHLILVMIYDDYLRLRDNIDLYLSAISQLFEKADNAQDVNRRK